MLEFTREDIDSLLESKIETFNKSHESIKENIDKFQPSIKISMKGKFACFRKEDGSMGFDFPVEPKTARLVLVYESWLEPSISIEKDRIHVVVGLYPTSCQIKNPSVEWIKSIFHMKHHLNLI